MRWIRAALISVGALALLSGLAMFELEWVPASALGWMLLPVAGAGLLLVESIVEIRRARARRVLIVQGAVLLGVIAVLLTIGLAVAWTHFA